MGCSPIAVPVLMRMAGNAVAKVVHRCQDAEENQKLDLSECQLMHVPDGVYHLMRNTIVLWCNLSSNVIRKIPPKFVIKFSNITDLNLSNNKLSSLPDELRDLTDMKRLDISSNHFDSLPPVVFKMPHINFINAEKNYVAEVNVAHFSEMPSLTEVNLRSNPLTKSSHDQLKAHTRVTVRLSELKDYDDVDMELDDLPED